MPKDYSLFDAVVVGALVTILISVMWAILIVHWKKDRGKRLAVIRLLVQSHAASTIPVGVTLVVSAILTQNQVFLYTRPFLVWISCWMMLSLIIGGWMMIKDEDDGE